MRIAWFTPFNIRSAIGRFSASVTAELAKAADVEIWAANEDTNLRETDLPIIRFNRSTDLSPLSHYDAVAYNFGNHLPYHREIFHASRRFSGIAVLHDLVMQHFFAAYYLEELKQPDLYLSAMARVYGAQAAQIAAASLGRNQMRLWETEQVLAYPLFEDVTTGAYGVIAHSRFLAKRAAEAFGGPVRHIPLAYEIRASAPSLEKEDLGIPKGSLLITTIGHVNRNKRVDDVIDALASVEHRRPFLYVVLGSADERYRSELIAQVNRRGLNERIRLPGHLDDMTLHAYLFHSDLCINLRYPATEGASASAIEQMLHGKAVVVSDTGFYSELPDDCVVKVRPGEEQDRLTEVLRSLIDDEFKRRELGCRARTYALRTFTAAHYAEQFVAFACEVRRAKPLLELGDRIGIELNQFGVLGETDIVSRVSAEMSELFCGRERQFSKGQA
jgi:glycosyltransferase involved in cell wall biosynthesis